MRAFVYVAIVVATVVVMVAGMPSPRLPRQMLRSGYRSQQHLQRPEDNRQNPEDNRQNQEDNRQELQNRQSRSLDNRQEDQNRQSRSQHYRQDYRQSKSPLVRKVRQEPITTNNEGKYQLEVEREKRTIFNTHIHDRNTPQLAMPKKEYGSHSVKLNTLESKDEAEVNVRYSTDDDDKERVNLEDWVEDLDDDTDMILGHDVNVEGENTFHTDQIQRQQQQLTKEDNTKWIEWTENDHRNEEQREEENSRDLPKDVRDQHISLKKQKHHHKNYQYKYGKNSNNLNQGHKYEESKTKKEKGENVRTIKEYDEQEPLFHDQVREELQFHEGEDETEKQKYQEYETILEGNEKKTEKEQKAVVEGESHQYTGLQYKDQAHEKTNNEEKSAPEDEEIYKENIQTNENNEKKKEEQSKQNRDLKIKSKLILLRSPHDENQEENDSIRLINQRKATEKDQESIQEKVIAQQETEPKFIEHETEHGDSEKLYETKNRKPEKEMYESLKIKKYQDDEQRTQLGFEKKIFKKKAQLKKKTNEQIKEKERKSRIRRQMPRDEKSL